jgi:hypothetical protein
MPDEIVPGQQQFLVRRLTEIAPLTIPHLASILEPFQLLQQDALEWMDVPPLPDQLRLLFCSGGEFRDRNFSSSSTLRQGWLDPSLLGRAAKFTEG